MKIKMNLQDDINKETKAWVIKETDTGRYRCQNLYVRDHDYHFNIVNAVIYDSEDEAKYQADNMNKLAGFYWLQVIPITININ